MLQTLAFAALRKAREGGEAYASKKSLIVRNATKQSAKAKNAHPPIKDNQKTVSIKLILISVLSDPASS